jgi:hypothetical protein
MDQKTVKSRWSSRAEGYRLEVDKTVGAPDCQVTFSDRGLPGAPEGKINIEKFSTSHQKAHEMIAALSVADRKGAASEEYKKQWAALARGSAPLEKLTMVSSARHHL